MILRLAQAVAWTRPLLPYPGWHFGIAEEPEIKGKVKFRLAIWDYFNRYRLQRPIIMDWYNGTRTYVYIGNDISRCLFVGGCIDPNELAFLNRVIEPGMVFIDVGANDGLYTLFAAPRVGKVLAIEPSSREFGRLHANIELNKLKNVTARQIALADQPGVGMLSVGGYEHEGQNTLGEFTYLGVELGCKEKVEIKRLDDLVTEEGLPNVDVIKLDLEGAEFLVLKGAIQTLTLFRPLLLLEVSDTALRRQGSTVAEVLSLLRSLSYEIYAFDETSGRPVKTEQYSTPLSNNIVAAHPHRNWGALKDSEKPS
jgi:FkbM family methyltransferase